MLEPKLETHDLENQNRGTSNSNFFDSGRRGPGSKTSGPSPSIRLLHEPRPSPFGSGPGDEKRKRPGLRKVFADEFGHLEHIDDFLTADKFIVEMLLKK